MFQMELPLQYQGTRSVRNRPYPAEKLYYHRFLIVVGKSYSTFMSRHWSRRCVLPKRMGPVWSELEDKMVVLQLGALMARFITNLVTDKISCS